MELYVEYKQDELDKVHAAEVCILKEIERICEKHQINYFACYGTLLGTIRHQGFIPWDDDLDIAMLRDDYVRFMEIAPNELDERFFLQTQETDDGYHLPFAKVRMNDTLFLEPDVKTRKMHHGLYVDIFPFDNICDDIEKRKTILRNVRVVRFIATARELAEPQIVGNSFVHVCGRVVWRTLHVVMGILHVSRKWLWKKFETLAQSMNGEETKEATLMFSMPENSMIEKDKIFPIIKMPYENTYINVPSNYEEYLRLQYGDYMKLPKKSDRINHKPEKLEFGDEYYMNMNYLRTEERKI